MTTVKPASNYSWLIAIPLLLIAVGALFYANEPVLFYLAGLWGDVKEGEYAHGYLVLLVSVYLIWLKKEKLAKSTPNTSFIGLLMLVGAVITLLFSRMADIQSLSTLLLLFVVIALVWTLTGGSVLRLLLLPLLYISFALPIWFPISPVLQDLTADVVFYFIRIVDIPAYRQANIIALPAGQLSIEEACSGLRYFLAALTLGVLYAYLNYSSLFARIMVVFFAAASAVVANFIRVFIVVYLGWSTEMQHELIYDHLYFGWYIFGGVVALLLVIDFLLAKKFIRSANITSNESEPEIGVSNGSRSVLSHALIVSIAILSVFSLNIAGNIEGGFDHRNEFPALTLSHGKNGWSGPREMDDDWKPKFLGALDTLGIYEQQDANVYAYLGFYPAQSQGKEIVNSENRITNVKYWKRVYAHDKLTEIGELSYREQLLRHNNSGQKRIVWYWYTVSGLQTNNEFVAKFLQVLSLVQPEKGAFVTAVATDIDDNEQAARKLLYRFVEDMQQTIQNQAQQQSHDLLGGGS